MSKWFYRGFHTGGPDEVIHVKRALKEAINECAADGKAVLIEQLVINAPSGAGSEVHQRDITFALFGKKDSNDV